MLELSTTPLVKNPKQKEKLYELACECTSVFLNERQAAKIIEEMAHCDDCKEPVYLVVEGEEIT